MADIKIIASFGCSFTQYPNRYVNWPKHLHDKTNIETLYYGQGAASNGVISKRVIFSVTELLKKYKSHEILVGIMWSGPDRYEFFHTSPNKDTFKLGGNVEYWRNPFRINTESEQYNYYLLNKHFDDFYSELWYKNFHDFVGVQINTLEHMLRVQWYLKLHNIKYFMTPYAPHTLKKDLLVHDEVKYLYDLIDLTNFLPVDDALTYMMNSPYWHKNEEDGHPPTEANLYFTETVIIPYLKDKGYIS